MKYAYILAALIILVFYLLPVNAYDELLVPVLEDSWITNGAGTINVCGNASLTLDAASNYNGQNYLLSYRNAVNINAVMKFNITDQVKNRVIYNVNFETVKTETATKSQRIYWYTTDSWDDDTINYTGFPIVSTFEYLRPYGFLPLDSESSSLDFINTSVVTVIPSITINDLYNDNLSTFLTAPTAYELGADGTATDTGSMCYSSSESGAGANLRFQLADFATREINIDDVGNQYVYIDLESGRSSLTTFPEYDLRFNPNLNILETQTPNAFYTSDNDNDNNLDVVSCGTPLAYSTATRTDINIPVGSYDIFCFNQTSEHTGKRFFGAIKFKNIQNIRGTSAEDLDFYYAMYSPDYASVSDPFYTPDPQQLNTSLQIYWITSAPFTTEMYYRVKPQGNTNYGAYQYLNNASNGYSTTHYVHIPAAAMVLGDFDLYFTGINTLNETYTSRSFQFSTIPETILLNETIPSGISQTGITFIIQESTQSIPVEATVYLRNSTGITRYGTTTFRTNESFPYGFFSYITFENWATGEYFVNVTASEYDNLAFNVTVDEIPFIYFIYLNRNPFCSAYIHASTQEQCELDARNHYTYLRELGYNVTSWYCEYDANFCTVYNQQGVCTQYGAWLSFACFNGNLPASGTINGTIPSGSGTGTPNVVQPASNFFAGLLGLTIPQTLILFSFIVTLIISISIAYFTKNGMVTAIIFIGMLVMFTGIGWFPLIYMILLGLVSALILARWIGSSMGNG